MIDDIIITRLETELGADPDVFHVVTNAGCREKDLGYLDREIGKAEKLDGAVVSWTVFLDQGLVALQGPLSAEILQEVLGDSLKTYGRRDKVDLEKLYFGQCKTVNLKYPGNDETNRILVSRAGYTGEDGFEISVPSLQMTEFTEHVLRTAGPDRLQMGGLGARDSLRLEAGMCLVGHDLDESKTPVEAGLGWIVHRNRRAAGGFYGDEKILQQLKPVSEGGGPPCRRIGMTVEGAPAREGAEIRTVEDDHPAQDSAAGSKPVDLSTQGSAAAGSKPKGGGRVIGKVTSGCPSPTLGLNIAMGYVDSGHHEPGTTLSVTVRGRRRKASVVKLPFVPSKFWKPPPSKQPLLKLTSRPGPL